MPSRLITAAILAFWLGMTGLLLQREVVPMMLAEVAPTFQIDLTDEIGSPLVGLDHVLRRQTHRVGHLQDQCPRGTSLRIPLHLPFRQLQDFHGLKTIESMDRVSEDGKLQALSMKIVIDPIVIDIEAEVIGQKLKPRILWNNDRIQGALGEIDMSAQSNVVSSLKLVSRLRGLHVGQT